MPGIAGRFGDRRLAERQIAHSERLLRGILDQALDAHIVVDDDDRTASWNAS